MRPLIDEQKCARRPLKHARRQYVADQKSWSKEQRRDQRKIEAEVFDILTVYSRSRLQKNIANAAVNRSLALQTAKYTDLSYRLIDALHELSPGGFNMSCIQSIRFVPIQLLYLKQSTEIWKREVYIIFVVSGFH